MNIAFSLIHPIAAWRRYAPANALRVVAICSPLVLLPLLAIYYAREPVSGPRIAIMGGQGGIAGAGVASPGLTVGLGADDPVVHFAQSRIGHILYAPYVGDNCRRVLFQNQTGVLYETGSVPCVQSAPETAAVSGADRLMSMRKSFQK